MIKGCRYGASVDWWALGVAMYVMLTGLFPFSDLSRKDLFHSIETEKVHLPIGFSKETASIIQSVVIQP